MNETLFKAIDPAPADPRDSLEPDPSGNILLYVIGSLDVGGTERHLALLVPRLRRLGWKPAVYCLTRPGQQANLIEQAGVQVISPPFAFAPNQERFPVRFFKGLLSALKLLWVMISTRPQVAHFFLPGAYLIGAPLSLLSRVPMRVMSRRGLNRYQENRMVLAWFERRLHRRMTAILGNSQRVVQELVEIEQCPPDRVMLIYNGVDVSAFETERPPRPTAEEEPSDNRPIVFITVANLIPYKGHSDLIEALAQIAPALPSQWSILFVGHDDGIGPGLKEQAQSLGIDMNVKFLGARADVASLLASADVGLLCSHEEGFANFILEGMAASLPMIVTDVGGNREAVVHRVTGLVVPPRDVKAIGAAILDLAIDADKRRAMGIAGHNRVKQHFSIDCCATRYARFYVGLQRGWLPTKIAAESLTNI